MIAIIAIYWFNFVMKIDDIKGSTFILSFLSLIFLIVPGIALIYLQKPELFSTLDWIKLILLAVSVTAPTAFLFIIQAVFDETRSGGSKDTLLFSAFTQGLVLNGLAIYIVLLLNHFFPRHLYEYFIMISLYCAIHLAFGLIWDFVKKKGGSAKSL